MANGNCGESAERRQVYDLFRAGHSKSDIARQLGKTKEQVGKLLAMAIRELGNGG